MKIPLNEFEQLIDVDILQRGLDYFRKGAISGFSELSIGEFEAFVSGTKQYTVHLKVQNNSIVDHHCDCPYDFGPVCKHTASVIFYFLKDELELSQITPKKPKTKKTKSISQQIKELLNTIPSEELVQFVSESCKSNRKFRNRFLTSFGHLVQNHSKAFYQRQIHSILQSATGRDGWINWSDMRYVSDSTQPLLDNAEQYLRQGNLEEVFFIGTALLEEMTDALLYGDDSNGDLGYFINSALELLHDLSKEEISSSLKQEFFNYCISAYKKNKFKGWDWHLGILHIAEKLTENENEADIILNCLELVSGDFDRERAQSYKLELLRRYKNPKDVEEFINKYISNSEIRTQEIEIAFENNNLDRVMELAKDGINCDEKDKPGLAKDWYDWLLKVALAQNDTSNIIKYARYRLINSFGAKMDYYEILKDTIETENWYPFLEEIILEVTPKKNWTYIGLIRMIYIKEEWWDRLLHMLKQNLSLENIQANEEYLAKDYSDELIEMYNDRIKNYIKRFVGRNHYQTACRYLRRMKKLGGRDQVEELKEYFRNQYPKRPALLDELNKV